MNLTREFKEKCRVSPKPVKWFYFYVKYLLLLQSFSNTVLVVLYLMVIKDAINDPTISIPLYISMVGTSTFIAVGALTVRNQMIRMKKKGIRWNRVYMTGSIILNLVTTVVIHDITSMEATNYRIINRILFDQLVLFRKKESNAWKIEGKSES